MIIVALVGYIWTATINLDITLTSHVLHSLVISVAWVSIASPGSVAGFSLSQLTTKRFGSPVRGSGGIIIFDRNYNGIRQSSQIRNHCILQL